MASAFERKRINLDLHSIYQTMKVFERTRKRNKSIHILLVSRWQANSSKRRMNHPLYMNLESLKIENCVRLRIATLAINSFEEKKNEWKHCRRMKKSIKRMNKWIYMCLIWNDWVYERESSAMHVHECNRFENKQNSWCRWEWECSRNAIRKIKKKKERTGGACS